MTEVQGVINEGNSKYERVYKVRRDLIFIERLLYLYLLLLFTVILWDGFGKTED